MAHNAGMKAPALKKGDTIGIMATSSWVSQEDLDVAKAHIEAMGYRVYIHPQATNRHNQSAGTAQEKVDAFHDLLKNPEIKAIFGARGGNRSMTMLDKIDFNLVAANPKIILGYSDVTAILNGVHEKTGLITFHAPVFREMPKRNELDQLFDLLAGKKPEMDFSQARIVNPGTAEGKLIGGNLSMLQALSGTPFQPDTDGAILFIEDVGDQLSRYDRMLTTLKLAGWFNRISGIIVGSFTDTGDDPKRPFGFTLEDMIREHLDGKDIPIVMDAPFGHGNKLYAFPVGGKAKLTAENSKVTLKLTEPAVKP